jgi:MFS family permease
MGEQLALGFDGRRTGTSDAPGDERPSAPHPEAAAGQAAVPVPAVPADPVTTLGRRARLLRRPAYHWRLVAMLAVTQTVGYGILYDSFAVFLGPTARTLHLSTATVTGALTASLLAGAAAAIPIGRWLDRHGGRGLMVLGSVVATFLVFAWSRVGDGVELYAVWIGIGLAGAGVLYEAAFPVIVSWFGAVNRVRAILCVTLATGFAPTVFLPLADSLSHTYGWRDAVALLAVVYGAVTVPLHLLVRRPPHRAAAASAEARAGHAAVVRRALRDAVFWVLAGSFVAETGAVATVSVLLVTMLHSLGHDHGFAATAAGLVGLFSVGGRLGAVLALRRWAVGYVTAVAFSVQGIGAAFLPVVGHARAGAIGCVMTLGLGYGVSAIARPAILTERYGTAAYATLAATWTVPLSSVRALAPLGAVVLWHSAGLASALDAAAGCCLLGAIGLALCVAYRPRARMLAA